MTDMSKVSKGPGVHSLDHFALQVPDLEEAEKFYTTFGLDVQRNGDELKLGCFGQDHIWAIIKGGADRKKLNYVSFGIFKEDMGVFRERLANAGITPDEDTGEQIWFHDPCGMKVELRVAAKSSPRAKRTPQPLPCTVGGRAAPFRREITQVHPQRFAHALFFTPDIKKTLDFYCTVLGLRISDEAGPIAFLHGIYGSDHHLVAFAESPSGGVGYHHSSWDVGSIEEIGLGAMQMEEGGYTGKGWGLGRHVLGSNYFQYVRDPWNSYVEFNFDIDYIPEGMYWEPNMDGPAPEDTLYLWGPGVPEDFVVNYEAE